jgi:hypothetical protein
MSWLRKMSANTVIRIQIQMKNKKNHSIDRNTCPVPNSEANVTSASLPHAALGAALVVCAAWSMAHHPRGAHHPGRGTRPALSVSAA